MKTTDMKNATFFMIAALAAACNSHGLNSTDEDAGVLSNPSDSAQRGGAGGESASTRGQGGDGATPTGQGGAAGESPKPGTGGNGGVGVGGPGGNTAAAAGNTGASGGVGAGGSSGFGGALRDGDAPRGAGGDAGLPLSADPRDAGAALSNALALPGTDARARLEPAPAPTPVVVDACAKFAAAYCDKLKACLPVTFPSLYGTDANCREIFAGSCRSTVSAPGVVDGAKRREECAEAAVTSSCTQFLSQRTACQNPVGALVEGTVCDWDGQCGDGLFCKHVLTMMGTSVSFSSCGVCMKKALSNGSCNGYENACPLSHSCVPTSSGGGSQDGICVPIKKTGEACTPRDLCNGRCRNGICSDSAFDGPGADCRIENNCDYRQDLFCNRLIYQCQARPPAAPVGAYCGQLLDGSGGFVVCAAGATCTGVTAEGFVRTCVALAAEGQACGAMAAGLRCKQPFGCVDGICAEVPQTPLTCK